MDWMAYCATPVYWFKHIVMTAGDLILSPETEWQDVPDDIRHAAEFWMKANGCAIDDAGGQTAGDAPPLRRGRIRLPGRELPA
jgi:hypothetical protein